MNPYMCMLRLGSVTAHPMFTCTRGGGKITQEVCRGSGYIYDVCQKSSLVPGPA